jgi:hypothetical protein
VGAQEVSLVERKLPKRFPRATAPDRTAARFGLSLGCVPVSARNEI